MRVLYICPDGILDDLGQQQVLPYIFGLNKNGYKFIILSFERSDRKKEDFLSQEKILKDKDIKWHHLPFYPGKSHRFLRLIFGILKIHFIFKNNQINLVHIRSINAGTIFLLSRIKCKYIYDIRAFAGQLQDYGLIRKSSKLGRLFTFFEKILINHASGIVVLDKSGSDYIQKSFNLNIPFKIIPTSTEVNKYKIIKKGKNTNNELIKFVLLGGAEFPYLSKKALGFVKYLISNGFNCSIDIINQRHHKFIKKVIKETDFPKTRVKVFPLKPDQIYNKLPQYDCGLVFIETGEWIKMSSPTKIGEYLAAGLHIVGLEGIKVLDRLAVETNCVDLLPRNLNSENYNFNDILKILKKIKRITRIQESIDTAKKHYALKKALKKYLEIYKNINV